MVFYFTVTILEPLLMTAPQTLLCRVFWVTVRNNSAHKYKSKNVLWNDQYDFCVLRPLLINI